MTHHLIRPSQSQSFWDRIAPRYARKPIKDPSAYQAMLEALSGELSPNDRLLELGCGTGSTALRIAGNVEHVTATDISTRMIDIAKFKQNVSGPENVAFHQADAIEAVAVEAFDVVFATSLLHLVDDLDAVLNQAFVQLKPGGRLITKTVCFKHANLGIRMMVRFLTWVGVAPNVTALSQADLEDAIVGAGFRIQRVSYFGKTRMNPLIVARRPVG